MNRDDAKSSKLKKGFSATRGASSGQSGFEGALWYSPKQSSRFERLPSLQLRSCPEKSSTAYIANGIKKDNETSAA
jgi:hypothetical protein